MQIHPQLLTDCHHLGKLSACELLLNRNAALPWFILVPDTELNDILDLPAEHREAVVAECAAVSEFIKKVLEKLGHTVYLAENGKVAVDTMKTESFDLVLMDIQMPIMNGVDALRVIRNLEQLSGKHQDVIALTAFALIGDKEKYLKMGFDGYLSKPVTTRALVDELTRVLAN